MFRLSAVLFTICFLCVGLGSVCTEYAETFNGMQRLLDVEATYVKHLELYLDKALQEQENIRRFMEHVENQHDVMDITDEYFGNPLNALSTINRFVNNWKHEVLDVVLSNQSFIQYKDNINDDLDQFKLKKPTSNDLLDATQDILNLQEIDNLPTSKLANEPIYVYEDTGENVTFTASECYFIGRSLYQLDHYDYATEWLQQARQHVTKEAPTMFSISKDQILEQLIQALQKQGSYKLAHRLNNEILKSQPKHGVALKNKIVLENKLALERIKLSNLEVGVPEC